MSLTRGTLLGLLATFCGSGCSRSALPAPEQPLVATPDAGFRAKRPPLPTQTVNAGVDGLQFETAVLPNGLTLWVANEPGAPDTSLLLVARDGGFMDNPLPAELLRLTTRALVEGGTRWSDGRIVAPPVLNGRRLEFSSGPTMSQLSLHALSTSLPSAFKILSRTLLYPTFTDLDAVKLAAIQEAQERSGVLSSALLEVTSAAAYGQPFAQQLTSVRIDGFREPDSATVQRCYRDVFRPESMALIAVGDVTLQGLQELATPELAAMTNSARLQPPSLPAAPQLSSRGRRVHFMPQPDRGQARVMLLQPAPATSAVADELPFALLAELAVGAVRSRANNTLRHEQGITYGVRPRIANGNRLGLLVIEADFEEGQTPQAIRSLLALLEGLATRPVTADELNAAKIALHAELERAAHNSQGLAALAADVYASHGTPERLANLPARLAAVTAADVQRVAIKYLRSHDLEIGLAGSLPLAEELSSLGELRAYTVDRGQ